MFLVRRRAQDALAVGHDPGRGGDPGMGAVMTEGTAGPRGLGTRRPRGSTRTPGGGRSATQLASPLTRRDITAIADDAACAA